MNSKRVIPQTVTEKTEKDSGCKEFIPLPEDNKRQRMDVRYSGGIAPVWIRPGETASTAVKVQSIMVVVFILSGVFFLNGCASLKEKGKKVWGSSIEHLERKRPEGRAQDFRLSPDDCFAKVEGLMSGIDAQVYLKDPGKRYMAVMGIKGHVDTTQAGIFFTGLSEGNTRVEISSISPRLVDDVSDIVFDGLTAGKIE